MEARLGAGRHVGHRSRLATDRPIGPKRDGLAGFEQFFRELVEMTAAGAPVILALLP